MLKNAERSSYKFTKIPSKNSTEKTNKTEKKAPKTNLIYLQSNAKTIQQKTLANKKQETCKTDAQSPLDFWREIYA